MKRQHDHYGTPKPAASAQLSGTMFDLEGSAARKIEDPRPVREPVLRQVPREAPEVRVPQWRRVLYAIASRPAKGFTRHELVAHFAGTAHPIPLASVCRVVGEKLLRGRLVEVSETITRESQAGEPNGVLYVTSRGRDVLAGEQAA